MLFMLLILILISFLMFNFIYLFMVLFLGFLVIFLMLVHMCGIVYVKFLVVLVYISGVVVFTLYISCMCWNINQHFSKFFLLFMLSPIFLFDLGLFTKFSDIGEFLWMYLFFSVVFSVLVTMYSLNLFKVAGSLRF